MQQDNEGGSEGMMKQNQDRRHTKPMMQGDDQQQHHQPQKCPRCESINTKFCYYNNYSLSQPRYFCKACRRYWTQGGTLRNVPVGGGCRKGKRAKTSPSAASASSSENSRPQVQSHLQPLSLGSSQNMINSTTTNSGNIAGLRTKESGVTLVSPAGSGIPSMTMGSFYSGGGFLNSLAAIQSLSNQAPPQSFALNHQQQHVGGDLGSTSSLNLLHGFNAFPSFGSQVQAQQRQFFQMGSSRENKSSSIGEHPYFATSSQSQHQNWHQDQAFISNTNPTVPDSTAFWSISTSNATPNSTAASAGSFPLNPTDHQWHDLPGYGPPP